VSQSLQAIRGMNDILPADSVWWLSFEQTVQRWLKRYGYQNIRMPLVEQTALFRRAIGEVTDIVEKEMYSWKDELNQEELTLRPEGTASCVRAAIEHSLTYEAPRRLWYAGPMYRHERPQKGRYRQFHQYGVESLGFAGPEMDAELIIMCAALWKDLGISGLRLELNTIGASEERARYRQALITYLEQHIDALDADAKRRMYTNPLRVLDSKNPQVQQALTAAPVLMDFLGEASLAHFATLKQLLNAAGVAFHLNPRLVRGLDYYNLTVFEWISDALGAQGTVCGGGRYDGLFAQLGGKPTPAAGFAMGCERLITLMQESGQSMPTQAASAYIVWLGEGTGVQALLLAEQLRAAGLDVIQHAGGGSFKSQMKKADASGARFALIIGEDELNAAEVTIKPLREAAPQQRCAQAEVAHWIQHAG
jgi:histidyl-tRNA synthetase